ncbi:Wadjet anti-phage system protein JetA family protein [Reyranella sp. CPCC 100927]|uniref:Wadjet anti-phage system protein JetA family protein n=1 Tax=Reyranella sp. CPCC 100927 TaxID=2599616 RepID=UPI0015B5EA10|nr:Wadjet anti-phage system protein JetA family protein [Reyranella sp. CPCC 100927]
MAKLFGYLPEALFQPLAGPKKHVYARLLIRLYERVFTARILETPTKDEVLRHIANVLAEAGVSDPDQLQEEGIEGDPHPHAHYIAYTRLKTTGWLVEEQDKWDVLVDMHPDAFMVIGAIADFAHSRIRVAGAVVEVKSNLEAAQRDPVTLAQGLANACETAVRFARSMRRILVGMRDIEDRILGNPDAASILRTFFGDFVDGLLIADYKQLKTSNNPYRYRRQISTLAVELLHDMAWRGALARAYIDQGVVSASVSLEAAEERVVSELEKIRQVFDDVGPFMERIEDFRDRLERRVRTTVYYMDVMGEGSAEKLVRVIERLAALPIVEAELRTRAPHVGFPISEKALYTPPPPRAAPAKTRFRLPGRDRYLREYVAATTAFDRMVRVTPAKMLRFIETKLGEKHDLHSSQISIESIEELLAFRALPALASANTEVEIGSYRIVRERDRTDNEWINVVSFRIERVEAGVN